MSVLCQQATLQAWLESGSAAPGRRRNRFVWTSIDRCEQARMEHPVSDLRALGNGECRLCTVEQASNLVARARGFLTFFNAFFLQMLQASYSNTRQLQ